MKKIFYITLTAISFASCFKKDDPITLPDETSEISTFFLGDASNNYTKEIFFDLSTNTYQEKQLAGWDLRFESSNDGFGIFINGGIDIQVAKSQIFNLNEPKNSNLAYINSLFDPLIQPQLSDKSNGKASNSAMGDWKSFHDTDGAGGRLYGIYFIKLSYLSGEAAFRRLQILGVNDSFYSCKISKLNEDTVPITKIHKNKIQNFTYYSFKDGGGIVDNAEPSKNNWDIEFTRYKTLIPLPINYYPYIITGVLSNPNNVAIATDFLSKFEDITGSTIGNYSFHTERDIIGYDNWKTFDLNSKTYTVHSHITYIIKDTDGHYFKLRFLDFYDKLRRTGNPKFEFVKIK